jgi:hypothetical protein
MPTLRHARNILSSGRAVAKARAVGGAFLGVAGEGTSWSAAARARVRAPARSTRAARDAAVGAAELTSCEELAL